jgi:hydrogenase maturation protein HypF
MGAEQKGSFCIGKNFQAVMSQYIGDLKNVPTYDFYRESIDRFSALFRFKPEYAVCDMHPDYFSTKYAMDLGKERGIPVIKAQHHHAHIASCMAECELEEKVIGISMDGAGYGIDGKTWGSEFLIADTETFSRFMHFDYVPMPGGDKVAQEPWRMAFSYLFKYLGDSFDFDTIPLFRSIGHQDLELVKQMIIKDINCPLTSGAGRLFDAVSAILGLCSRNTFDSEAPMRLESAIDSNTDLSYPFSLGGSVIFRDTFQAILSDLSHSNISVIAAKFHNTIAQIILDVSEKIRNDFSINKVVLSGGVFQNKYLLEKSVQKLLQHRFTVYTNHLVPSNDGGISLGQLVIASKTLELCA